MDQNNNKYDFLKTRVTDVDDHLLEVSNQTHKKFNIIKENITKITKQLDEEVNRNDLLMDSKNNYIKNFENKIMERFHQEAQIREEIGKKLFSVIDDKFNALKVEISKESRNRFESIENLKSYL